MTPDELLAIARRIAGWARDDEQVEAYVAHRRDTDVRAYEGEVESLSSAEAQGVGVRVVSGRRQGFAYAGVLDDDALAEVLADARDNASFATADEHTGLPEPDGVQPASIDPFDERLAEVPTDRKIELALEMERAVRAVDPRVSGIRTADYGDVVTSTALASNTGIAAAWRRTACAVSVLALATDGDETQTGSGYSVGRHPDDLDVDDAARDAAERATRLLGAGKPPSARGVTVVFDRPVAAQLVGLLGATLNGEAVLKGRSLFADRVGEAVAVPAFTLVDDPTHPEAYTAAAYDAEGLASRRTELLRGGVLQGFVHNTWSGRKAGVPSTASAVRGGFKGTPAVGCRALQVVPGELDQEQVIAEVDDGLFVQGMTGLHSGVNLVSGDFSVGATGLVIRGGALAEPVKEMTIATTIQRMLQSVVVIGGDVEWLPQTAMALTLAVGDVTVSGA